MFFTSVSCFVNLVDGVHFKSGSDFQKRSASWILSSLGNLAAIMNVLY